MKNLILLLFVISTSVELYGQDEPQIFEPSNYYSPDLSVETKVEIERQTELFLVKDKPPKFPYFIVTKLESTIGFPLLF